MTLNYKYIFNLSKKILEYSDSITKINENIDIKAFASRLNQISYIKHSIVSCANKGINPENIAVVLPDENFAKELELFDNEKYFNFAMGKNILNKNLYQKANVIYNFLKR